MQIVAETVLNKLFETAGYNKFSRPRLILSKESKRVAAFYPARNTIVLDKKAYEVCRSFRKDSLSALAFVLGHELAHAFQSELRNRTITTNFLSYDRYYSTSVRVEKVADIQGLFNAHLAGYDVLRVVPDVLDRLYEAYGLKGKVLKGYPSLDERRLSSAEVSKIVTDLIDLFEGASALVATHQHQLAVDAYEYILQYYQGREIWNNLGVIYVLNALDYYDPVTDKYIYPLELDANAAIRKTELSRGEAQLDNISRVLRQKLLEKAELAFREATRISPGYEVALTNRLCALSLMKKPLEAIATFRQEFAAKKKHRQMSPELDLALAIAYALMNDDAAKGEARSLLQMHTKSANPLCRLQAIFNLGIIDGKLPETGEQQAAISFPDVFREHMSSMKLGRLDDLESVDLSESKSTYFLRKVDGNVRTLVFGDKEGHIISFQKFQNRLAARVDLLDDGIDLKNQLYSNIFPVRNGFFVKSEKDRFLLRVDAAGKVQEMIKYYHH